MVVLTIISIITVVVLTSQSSFNKSLVLANAAYDIALTIRSAETFGLGTRAAGATVNAGYGLHFQSSPTNTFILFADTSPTNNCDITQPSCKSGDHAYTSESDESDLPDLFVQTYTLGNRVIIENFCAYDGSWECVSDSPSAISSLDIVFERPNPNAYMSKNGIYSPASPVTVSCLTVTSPHGGEKYITVQASGQIIANAASCP